MSKSLHNDQQGFASMVVALTMIVVLALLTVGFTQLSRREQESALDKQLASQAVYAAETGINDAIKQIKLNAIPVTRDPNRCLPLPGGTSSVIDSYTAVSYNCVLINMRPPSLVYDNVASGSARNVRFSTSAPMESLRISWGSKAGRDTFETTAPGGSSFGPLAGWDKPGVLHIALTPLDSLDRQALIDNTINIYAYPSTTGTAQISATSALTTNVGEILSGQCNKADSEQYPCSVVINGLSSNRYALRIANYYDASNMLVTATDTTGSRVNFLNGQAQIDVTGKAKDVLKRLSVRYPLNSEPNLPLEAGDICKRQQTEPGGTDYKDLNSAPLVAGSTDACRLDT